MGRRWKDSDLNKLRPGMVNKKNVELQGLKSPAARSGAQKKCRTTIKAEPEGLREIKAWLRALKIDFVTEHRFHETRKWRFDIAILEHLVAIEYEGINSESSRHTTLTGYTGDATKYNEAQKLGWRVLRYTMKNYTDFLKDITDIIQPNDK